MRSPPPSTAESPPAESAALWGSDRITALAEAHGTPLFAYDVEEIGRRVARVRAAFGERVALLYAVKANPLPGLLNALRNRVDGLDIASQGELRAALSAGYRPEQLRIAGPGKTTALLTEAVKTGASVSVEAPSELAELAQIARQRGERATALLRLEPRVIRHTFGVRMGEPTHPFGLDEAEIREALEVLAAYPDALELIGVHVYGGTQCRSVRGWLGHLAEALDLAAGVMQAGFRLREINVGGGFGVGSPKAPELDVSALGAKAQRLLDKVDPGPRFVLELGRFLVADAGVYVSRVLRTKRRGEHRVAVLDGGVHHLWAATGQLGPAPVARAIRGGELLAGDNDTTHLMGPLCTPLDHLGTVPGALRPGDLVVFFQVGAYGATLSPVGFLGHGPAREVLTADRPEPAET